LIFLIQSRSSPPTPSCWWWRGRTWGWTLHCSRDQSYRELYKCNL